MTNRPAAHAALVAFVLCLGAPQIAFAQSAGDGAAQSAALARAAELVAVLTGSPEDRRTFVAERLQQVYAPAFLEQIPMENHAAWLDQVAGAGEPPTAAAPPVVRGPLAAAAPLWNPLREELDSVFVRVEEAPPHRIAWLGIRAGAEASVAPVATEAELAAELERYVGRLSAAGQFSGVVVLARDGRPVFARAYGLANRDFEAPNRLDTRFNLGSLDKTFTALVIGQLVEEGRLAWDDPLSRFVPDFPNRSDAQRIQIRHLLTHTSGLGSYFNDRFFESSRARWRTVDDLIELASPDSLAFEPGTRWSYSNTGYVLLGKVIEVVTGRTYDEAVRERIFDRAGMTDSRAFALDSVNHNLAVGYARAADGSFGNNLFMHVVRGGPAGGGYSTAYDLVRLSDALRAGTIVSPATLRLMREPKPEIGSSAYGYGFLRWLGPELWGHGGDFPGIDADWHNYGDSGWTVVVLANQSGVNPPIVRRVGRLIAAPPPPAPPTAASIVGAMHERYTALRPRTATFVQRSLFADGREETWYEAVQAPGMLRIDTSIEDRNAMIFRNDSLYVFRNGERANAVAMVHPLLLMLSDVYVLAPSETLRKLRGLGFDTESVRETLYDGRRTWVIGAEAGDTTSNQVWIDVDGLYPVRMIQTDTHPRPGRRETLFLGWSPVGGAPMESLIIMRVDGRDFLREEYYDRVPHATHEPGLFDPDRYRAPAWVRPYVGP